MAWTTPRTWETGELVTKSILDAHVRDNLMALKFPPSMSYECDELGDYLTTNTVSFVVVDSTNMNFTLTTDGGDVMIGFFGTVHNASALAMVYFNVYIDDVLIEGDDGLLGVVPKPYSGSSSDQAVSFVTVRPLAAGEHSFKLAWRVSAGSGYLFNGAGTTTGRDLHPQFWVREV